MATADEVTRAVATLRVCWGDRIPTAAGDREAWLALVRLLARYDGPALVSACESLALTRPTLYPDDNLVGLIAQEIGRQATGGEPSPEDVTDWILGTIRAHGRNWSGTYPTDLHRQIVREAGGWFELCAGSEEKTERALARACRSILRERKAKAEQAMRPELAKPMGVPRIAEKPADPEKVRENLARVKAMLGGGK